MPSLLYCLYDALGLDAPEDEPFIRINDELEVYFNESEAGLEMCCPFMPLPSDVMLLMHFLRLNYTSPIIIAIDDENTALLALIRLPHNSTDEELLAGLELLIAGVGQLGSVALR